MTINQCVKCGVNLSSFIKKACANCKKTEKNAIDNLEISVKYKKTKDNLFDDVNRLSDRIDKELNKLESIKLKFILNKSNEKPLNLKENY